MAKKTKDSNLSLEEKLEQALIPNWDEPYKLPDNWCWLKLLSAFDNYTDSKKKIQQKNYLSSGLYAIIDQGQKLVGGYTDDESMLYDKNLPVVIFGDHTRCVKYVDFSFAQGADGVKVLRPKPFYFPKLFYYAMQSVDIPNLGYRRHFPLFDKFAIPLPPLDEQHRIVARIESLFAKLDEAKEKAQEVIDGFETRKAAILHKTFSGELTAKLRLEKQIDDNYSKKSIGELFTHTTGKALKKGNTTGLLRKYITTSNVYWGEFDFSEIREMYFTEKELDKCTAHKGDLLICNGGDVGRAAIWEYDYDICLQNHISKLRPKQNDVDVKFIYYYFMNSKMRGAINGKGIGISSLSAKDLLAMKVMLPTFVEQQKIVEILDSLINNELKAKETAEAVIEQIDTMKKAILARAFRGELGTNDPSEESAVELLKQII